MPDYTTGTYSIRAKKDWNCEGCHHPIRSGLRHFVRIEEYGNELRRQDGQIYRNKIYHRYHFACAMQIKDLNSYEKSLCERQKYA